MEKYQWSDFSTSKQAVAGSKAFEPLKMAKQGAAAAFTPLNTGQAEAEHGNAEAEMLREQLLAAQAEALRLSAALLAARNECEKLSHQKDLLQQQHAELASTLSQWPEKLLSAILQQAVAPNLSLNAEAWRLAKRLIQEKLKDAAYSIEWFANIADAKAANAEPSPLANPGELIAKCGEQFKIVILQDIVDQILSALTNEHQEDNEQLGP